MAPTMSTLSLVEGSKYPAKAHCQRVASQLNIPKGLILLQGAKTKFYPNSDQAVPFRQNRYFYYLSGVNEPGCWITYEAEKDKLTIWLPKPAAGQVVQWNGRKGATIEEAKEKYDVDEVKYIQHPAGKPKRTNLRKVLFDHYATGGAYAFLKMPKKLIGKPLKMKMKERRALGLRAAVHQCRAVKDEYEVAAIRKAAAVSAEAHADVMKQLHMLKSEHEVEALYLSTCLAHRAKEQAFNPTFAAGSNAGLLKYKKNDADFENAQVVMVNAGAQWNHYASSLTRTLPLSPGNPGSWPSEEAEAVYAAVSKIQDECIKQLAPGKKFIEVAWTAMHMTIDALLEMGLLKGDHMEIFHAGTALAFFPHGLGHFVGLEAHDVAPMPVGGWKKIMQGMARQAPKKVAGPKKAGAQNGAGPKKTDALNEKAAGPKGPAGPKGLKKAMQAKIQEVRDEEKQALLAEDPLAEKPAAEKKGAKKPSWGKPAGPGPKKGGSGQGKNNGNQAAGPKNGKGKGKQAATPKKLPTIVKDRRFARTQGAYRTFCSGNEALYPRSLGLKPAHYSLRPRMCRAPNTPTAPALEAGNVLAIKPGMYFNRAVLEKFFLNKKKHAQFIDAEVLEKFMAVGGVSVADTVLINNDGCEVLTAGAMKGGDMVEVIKEGWSY